MNGIPEEALRTIEESFGTRFVQHAAGEAEPHAEQAFASVFPENAAEVESWSFDSLRQEPPSGPSLDKTHASTLYSDGSKTSQEPLMPISLA